MTTHVIMNVDRPNGSGGTYKAGIEYDLADDLAALWRGMGICRLTTVRSEQTGAVVSATTGNFPDAPAMNKRIPVEAIPSGSGHVFEAGGIDITEEIAGAGGGGSNALPSGTYSCDVGTRTWTGTIKPAILTLTPGAGGTAYIEATEDGSTWVVWSEGVVSTATTARLAGPVVGLRVVSTVAASSLGVVA